MSNGAPSAIRPDAEHICPALDGADLDTKVSGIRRVVHSLPNARYDLLKRIIEHLDKYVYTLSLSLHVLTSPQGNGL